MNPSTDPTARERSDEFLKISHQFKLGALVTESSHPVTAHLSEVAKRDIAAALDLLFQVDSDVLATYREFVDLGRAGEIKETVVRALQNGGNIFFTGCGSTGRLSIQLVSIWRDFWQQAGRDTSSVPSAKTQSSGAHEVSRPTAEDFENRAFPVMAGGDFALIKAVEGFEDFTAFGGKQIGDLGVTSKDVVFAITEGGETSFVIGTAWKGVEVGAKVYFVYNNPDDILCQHVQRSREVIQDGRIEKINLTTGPMGITGSTRMQATSIQLAVMVTILEMAVRDLTGVADSSAVPEQFLNKLTELHATLKSAAVLAQLAKLVAMEESVYRAGHKNNYFADRFGIDVLTDTTERSPTYCTPPFRKFDDTAATESWAFLYVPYADSPSAWERVCKRTPRCIEWFAEDVRGLVPPDKLARTEEILGKISYAELMRFKIGLDGFQYRTCGDGDSVVGIFSENESSDFPFATFLSAAQIPNVRNGFVHFGSQESYERIHRLALKWDEACAGVFVPVPKSDLLLDGVTRVGVKLLLNTLSTCTMVRLGRVMGNYMIWVVASNLKLIDRATRYIQKLTDLDYEASNRLLFEAMVYIEPRMKSDQAYPPVVGLSVMRHRHGLSNEEAERRLKNELG